MTGSGGAEARARTEPGTRTEGRLRPCILVGRYPPDFAGHGIQLQRLLPHLRAAGVDPTVVAYRPPDDSPFEVKDAAPVHRTLARGDDWRARMRRVVQLRRHLRRHASAYDLVHSARLGWELWLNLPYCKRLGLPVVFEMVLIGGDDPLTVRGYPLGGLKLWLMRHVDAWVGISDAFRSRVVQAGVPEERFHRIYGSVDVERYRPAPSEEARDLRRELGIPLDARVAISIGSVIPRKGMDRVLAAWEASGPRPGRDLLLIVGPTEPNEGIPPALRGHVEELRSRAESPVLAGTVRFTGGVDDVHRWLAASDLFVFLSRQEGMGYVIVEAMACGLPCIVSPLDGIGRELVDEGVTGHVTPDPDDARVVGARLRAWLDDPGRLAELGAAARRTAEERFSMQARAEALASLYRSLVAGSAQGR